MSKYEVVLVIDVNADDNEHAVKLASGMLEHIEKRYQFEDASGFIDNVEAFD